MNNNYPGNYMKNLLYAFNTVCNHYNIGCTNRDIIKNRIRVILVNLNWYNDDKKSKRIVPKKEIILPYPEDMEEEFLIKIININLVFYKKSLLY